MGVAIVEWRGTVLGVNVGRSIVNGGDDFVALLCESDALFPNYFEEDLLRHGAGLVLHVSFYEE